MSPDKDSIPAMRSLQNALMNENEEDVEEFMSMLSHLTRFAINDPGVPNPKEVSRHVRGGRHVNRKLD